MCPNGREDYPFQCEVIGSSRGLSLTIYTYILKIDGFVDISVWRANFLETQSKMMIVSYFLCKHPIFDSKKIFFNQNWDTNVNFLGALRL